MANGLRHFRAGDVARGAVVVAVLLRRRLGQPAPARVLRALQSVVAHDRLDTDFEGETELIAVAEAVLDTGDPVA